MKILMTSAIALGAIFTIDMSQPVKATYTQIDTSHIHLVRGHAESGERGEGRPAEAMSSNRGNVGNGESAVARDTATDPGAVSEDRSHTLGNSTLGDDRALRNDNAWGDDGGGWTGAGCSSDPTTGLPPC